MKELIEAAKVVPELTKAVYSDAVAGTLQEIGKIGVDVVRTVRLALFPLQYSAALQDRLAAYINESVRKVPEERRISPPQSLTLDVCERLKNCDPSESVSRLYVELLARAMDKERVGEAHPAFVQLIGQLAPDEVALVEQLGYLFKGKADPQDHLYVRNQRDVNLTFTKAEVLGLIRSKLANATQQHLKSFTTVQERAVEPERLAQPELFATFLHHLNSMGLLEYVNNDFVVKEGGMEVLLPEAYVHCIRLSAFGRLFYRACVNEQSRGESAATAS